MIKAEDFKDQVLIDPRPVIFLDTCTILDTINAIHLKGLSESYLENVSKLMCLFNENKIWLVTSQNVKEEFDDNFDAVALTAKQNVMQIVRSTRVLSSYHCAYKGIAPCPLPQYLDDVLIKQISDLAQELMNNCILLERKPDYSCKAMDRVRANQAPAKKGGGEAKDCEIIECFLDASSMIRRDIPDLKIVFVTSNVKDYGRTPILLPPLHDQFEALDLLYSNHLNHVIYLCEIT